MDLDDLPDYTDDFIGKDLDLNKAFFSKDFIGKDLDINKDFLGLFNNYLFEKNTTNKLPEVRLVDTHKKDLLTLYDHFTNLNAKGNISTRKSRGKEVANDNVNSDSIKFALTQLKKLLVKKVLFIGAECENMGFLDIKKEFAYYKRALKNEMLEFKMVKNPNIEEITSIWDKFRPSIIFISCHGDDYGLYLEDANGNCTHYPNTEFTSFFGNRNDYTDCVILSACSSFKLGKTISKFGRNVVCTNKDIDVDTAKKIFKSFFKYINDNEKELGSVYYSAYKRAKELSNFKSLKDTSSFEFFDSNKIK